MLIIGAKGHAKEILDILQSQLSEPEICFFDTISNDLPEKLFNRFRIIRTIEEAREYLSHSPAFALGLGQPRHRRRLVTECEELGGVLHSVIASTAQIGKFGTELGDGLNVMHHTLISSKVQVGRGSLINAGAQIHHDSIVGDFCEISPKAVLTGGVHIGDSTIIGAGAVVLAHVTIGANCIIGAGAVVTQNIPDYSLAVGVPAKVIRSISPDPK